MEGTFYVQRVFFKSFVDYINAMLSHVLNDFILKKKKFSFLQYLKIHKEIYEFMK